MRQKALIVEGDPATRNLLKTLMEAEGCAVDIAIDGKSALLLLSQRDYAVIVLDVVLPKLSGTAVMDQLRIQKPEALQNIIVVTGLDVGEIRKLFPTVWAALGKPVIPGTFVRSVQKRLATGIAVENGLAGG